MEPTRILGVDGQEEITFGALPAGTALSDGVFIITGHLGQGGFGMTYLAKDVTLGRQVVIKECFPESICFRKGKDLFVRSNTNAPHFRKCVEMFTREARSIARLVHPNIVAIHSIFEENKTAYLVLDLIEGSDLLDIIEDPDRALSPAEICEVTRQTLEALRFVHDQNLLHRDISPDNILIDEMGQPILIDFGSAREFASERTRQKSTLLFVKDGYSPFEFYVSGAAHSPASDLYALGGTIYHVVTGEAPPSSQLRHAEIQAGNPDPYQPLLGRFDLYDDVFLAAIDMALELRPAQRLQSAEHWLAGIAQSQSSPKPTVQSGHAHLPDALGNLISETNKHVVREGAATQKPDTLQLSDFAPSNTQLIWRDEFNQETKDILASQEAAKAAEPVEVHAPTDPDPQKGRGGFFAMLRRLFAKEMQAEAEEDVEALMLEAYLRKQKEQKKRRASGIGAHRVEFFLAGTACALAIALYTFAKDGPTADEAWFGGLLSERVCGAEDGSVWSFVPNNCETGVRRINLEDRSGIRPVNN